MTARKKYNFCIAEHPLSVEFANSDTNDIDLLPSLHSFKAKECNDGSLFKMIVDDNIRPKGNDGKEHIGDFDTGNGNTTVDFSEGNGYQFIINDIHGNNCCLLQTGSDFKTATCALYGNKDMRRFGLNNALMMVFAFAGSFYDTLLIHASLVRNNGYGYAFTAKSGTGKSTHTSLWLKYIEGSDLMNDDNPIIRIFDGKAFIYGSPWSGKTPCYRNTKAPLGAVAKIERAESNWVETVRPSIAFSIMLPACSSMRWDKKVFDNTCNTITRLIASMQRIYILHCRPDKEAAIVCHDAIAIK